MSQQPSKKLSTDYGRCDNYTCSLKATCLRDIEKVEVTEKKQYLTIMRITPNKNGTCDYYIGEDHEIFQTL